MKWLCLFLVLSAATPAIAANASGQYWDGGGIGRVKCVGLINTLATVRQKGGFGNANTVPLYDNYIMYLAGFQTAYDAMTPGIYNIFKGLDDPDNVLVAMEPYCQQHPTASFDDALWELVGRLSQNPEVQ